MKYIKSLDGLRTIAVTLVIISHWFSANKFIFSLRLGEIGVDIFFVISGFLITSILLKNRLAYYEKKEVSRLKLIRQFIVRRTLRIFPIYYLTIIFLFFVASKTATHIKEDFIYYLTYTSNINFYLKNSWDGIISPLWSLAVEEQFYLIWPWIILFCGQKYLLPIIVTTIFVGYISNYFFSDFGYVLTPTCFDAFGIGGFIAYDRVYKRNILKKNFLGLLLISLILIIIYYFTRKSLLIPLRTVVAFSTASLIVYLLQVKNTINIILSTSILVFIGKISYGIYLYHNIVAWLWENTTRKLNLHYNHIVMAIQEFALLILLAWLSWSLIEKRINNLKKRFAYISPDNHVHVQSNLPISKKNISAT
ncbi:MAG: hypothetical protein JWN83_1862 [Chitinophagaceae bacterium]|nr:hypothetical protein [Chitinophagaceae bacterium]